MVIIIFLVSIHRVANTPFGFPMNWTDVKRSANEKVKKYKNKNHILLFSYPFDRTWRIHTSFKDNIIHVYG